MSDKKVTVALFDFDHTITTKDTFIDFTSFMHGRIRVAAWIIIHVHYIFRYLSGTTRIDRIKDAFYFHFFSGVPEQQYLDSCRRYAKKRINPILNKKAVNRIEWHKARGDTVIILSASLDGYIRAWADNYIDDVIATRPEIRNGVMTGRFETKNCNAKEKVRRFSEKYPDREKYIIYAYGDSAGDRAMLDFADYPFYRRFE